MFIPVLRRTLFLGLWCAVTAVATGCSSSIVGAYDGGTMAEGSQFHIARATFKDDNTFTAYAKRPGAEGQVMNGSYTFDGFKLKLKQAGKPERAYGATYNMFGRSLQISGENGAKQTLKKM
ncbi:MAG: hypothetical protein IPK83_07050 [Planctomycetes bacterium]|nr:hypothetical protein [Planctomycetota bacterium]